MRLFTLILIAILATLQYDLFFGKNGIVDYQVVSDDIEVQQKVNASLRKRNDLMYAEIEDLRQGLDAVEERARHELGMIKEGETFYRILGDDSASNSTFNSDDN